MKKRMFLFLYCLFLSMGVAVAQNQVTGSVIYADDGSPVIGATIRVVGHDNVGTVTDANGKFSLDVPKGSKQVTASYVGMVSKAMNITPGKPVTIALQLDATNLDEVIVVAYGTAKKSAFTGSASVIKAEDIANRQVSNVTNALDGAVAGVQTKSYNGQPGSTAAVYIRGIGSMNTSVDTNPLYVVDGVPFEGDISSLNNQDIESMSVLKDAAAAALYGARGANGVILITTKKGKSGEAKITLDARVGTNQRMLKRYDVMGSTAQYMETLYSAYSNAAIQNLGYTAAQANVYANENIFSAIGLQIYTLPRG